MRIYYDCEMVERGRDLPIQLVSIGMVREDGSELYRINPESLSNVSKNPWLSVNVGPYLPIKASPGILAWDEEHAEYEFVSMSLDGLINDVRAFIQGTPSAELWAHYGAYDHVALCQLFGSMAELPAGIPMFTHDVQQLIEMRPGVVLPAAPWKIHHALDDARWARDVFNAITGVDAAASATAAVTPCDHYPGDTPDTYKSCGCSLPRPPVSEIIDAEEVPA